MSHPLIGQVLSRMGRLSAIDIDEILVEQAVTRRQFGEIALAWGLCEPEQLCEAWCSQLAESGQRVDLSVIGVHEPAIACVPAEVARRLDIVPLRSIANQLVVAASRVLNNVEMAELVRVTGKDVRVVCAEAGQIQEMIEHIYPKTQAAAWEENANDE